MSYSVSTTKSLDEIQEFADQLSLLEKWKLVNHLIHSLRPESKTPGISTQQESDYRFERAAMAANSVSTHEDWDQYKARQARSYPPLEGEQKLSPDDLKALNEEQMKIAMALRRSRF